MGSGTEMPAISAETAEPTNGSAATSKKDSNLLLACFHVIPESCLLVENERVRVANPAAARLFGCADAHDLAGVRLENLLRLETRFCRDMLERVMASRWVGRKGQPSAESHRKESKAGSEELPQESSHVN